MIQKIKNQYHLLRSVAFAFFYGFPSKKLKVIGVTGTDGKTTTTALLYHILNSAGKRVSMVSTVYAKIGTREYETGLHTTTPDGKVIQMFLLESKKNGDEFFILETTSHALDQNRNFGITCEVAVLTNITHEHLDYHKTFDAYVKAKTKLFQNARVSVLNEDDKAYPLVQTYLKSSKTHIVTYGKKESAVFHQDMVQKTQLPLSPYNQYNFLAAYAACIQLGLTEEQIISAMKTYVFPKGRMETVYNKDFTVIIDFAHTPNGIDKALEAVHKQYKEKRKIIHVFGSASKRDSSKRPFMGEASAKWADEIILTEEDYREEDPNKICQEIAQGIPKGKKYTVLTDRQKAIDYAISIAKKNDIVIITGKGHEQSLCRGKKEYPWDDTKAVSDAVSKNI